MSDNDKLDDIDFKELDQKINCEKCGKEINKYSQFLHNTICNLKNDVDFKYQNEISSSSVEKDDHKDQSSITPQKNDIEEYIKYYEEKIRKMREGNEYKNEAQINTQTNLTMEETNQIKSIKYDQKYDDPNDTINETYHKIDLNIKENIKKFKITNLENKEKLIFTDKETVDIHTDRSNNNFDYPNTRGNEEKIKTLIGNLSNSEDSFETDFNKEIVDEIACGKDEFLVKTNIIIEGEETKQNEMQTKFKETNLTNKSNNNSLDDQENNYTEVKSLNLKIQNKGTLEEKIVQEYNPTIIQKDVQSKNKIQINTNCIDINPNKLMKTPQNKGKNNKLQNLSPKKPPIISSEFLEKIEKTENMNNEETKKQLEEIQTIESNLKLDQRLINEKWQVRKNAFREVANILEFLYSQSNQDSQQNDDEELNQAFDTFSPWMIYFLTDTNITTLAEGLQTFFIFMKLCEKYRHKALFQYFDELEKIISMNKNNIIELCEKIIDLFLKDKKLKNFTVNELLKKMVSKNNKLSIFAIENIVRSITEFNETYIKLIFEKALLHYSNTESKNSDRKKNLMKVIIEIYKRLYDTFDTIKKTLNLNSELSKDLEKSFKRVEKENMIWRLYKIDETECLKKSHLQQQPSAYKVESTKTEDVDLISLLPENFKDFSYLTHINKKVEMLKNINLKLNNLKSLALKDYKAFYDTLDYAIADSNILVHFEAIKILTNICRLLQMHINYNKLKVLLYSCFDKFSDNKTNVKNQLFVLLDTILFNFCIQVDSFIDFTLQFVMKQKNTNIKQNIVEFLKSLFEENSKIDENRNIKINGLLNSLDDGNLVSLIKQLTEVIKNENSHQVKDICTDIIILVKSRINDQTLVEKCLDNLPRYRKQLIGHDYSSEKTRKSTNYSKEPVIKPKNIKANISFNSRKELNLSVNKDDKPKFRENSKSIDRKNNLNNTLQEKLKNKVKENLKTKVIPAKFISKNSLKTNLNESSNNENNIKIIVSQEEKESKLNIDSNNSNYMSSEIDKSKLSKIKIKTNDAKVANSTEKQQVKPLENTSNNNIESMCKLRTDPVIKKINSCENSQINDYAKKVIRDFLIFIKNHTASLSGDDLRLHYIVIIKILDKLFEKIQMTNSEEIIMQSTKIIIVSPCFLKEERIYFDEIMEKLKKTLNNEQRFFNIVIGVLEKFNNTTMQSSFLKNIDPKVSFLAVFNYFIKTKFEDIVFQALKKIIDNCIYLQIQEKNDYINKINSIINHFSDQENENKSDQEEAEENEFSKEEKSVDLESSLLKDKININTYNTEEKYDYQRNQKINYQTEKIVSNEEYKLMTNAELDNEKQDEEDKEEISIIHKENQSCSNSNSEEEKFEKNLAPPKSDWIEKYKDEVISHSNQKKTHIETLTNLEKTSKDYLSQVNENEKLKEKMNLLIKQNQLLLHGITKLSDEKEKALPKQIENPETLQVKEVNSNANYDCDITNMKAKLNDKCRSFEMNLKNIENKLNTKPINNLITDDDNNGFPDKKQDKFSENTDSKMFKPIKTLENFQDNDNSNFASKVIKNLPTIPFQKPDYKTLIVKIASNILDSDISVTLYVKLENIYSKLENEDRIIFIEDLKVLLENNDLMNAATFNCLLLFFEFLVNLLVFEIKIGSKYTLNQKDLHRNLIFKVQENIENLIKKQKNLSYIFLFQIYLLKKYLPRDFKIAMDRDSLIYIKVVSHLLKSSNEILMKSGSEIFILDILKETNDLFVKFPSQNLVFGIPNLEDLDKVYSQLRIMVDNTVVNNIQKTQLFVKNVKSTGSFCPIFIQYLENIM